MSNEQQETSSPAPLIPAIPVAAAAASPKTPNHIQHPQTTAAALIEHSLSSGGVSLSQVFQTILVALARVFDAQQSFISIFTDANPQWHCVAGPHHQQQHCNSDADICKLDHGSWAWTGTKSKTIISDWSLECSSAVIMSLPASAFFVGCLIGGLIFPTLSDTKLGRRNLLLLSCSTMSAFSLITISSTNIWVYTLIRFLTGLGRSSIGPCVVVLVSEKVGQRWRGRVVMFSYLCFSVGFLTLAGIAYANRDQHWRLLYLWTSVPGVAYSVVAYFLVMESPAWLLIKGRGAEAHSVLQRLAPWNDYTNEVYKLIIEHPNSSSNNDALASAFRSYFSSMRLLFSSKWNLRRIIPIILIASGIGVVYFGIPLGVGNLGFDIYLSSVLNALIEIPSFVITIFLVERYSRRGSLLLFCTVSGGLSVGCAMISEVAAWVRVVVEMGAFVTGCVACNVVSIYTTELFPVKVRNTAVAVMWEAIMLGAVLAPVFVKLGKQHIFLSYGVFGVVIVTFGLFAVVLPETKDMGADLLVCEEGEAAGSNPQHINC
uniref:Major facilitator superfamily (MFS) profile domain-containing protein n=1 Tax=Kalanchoe fedtschenkoi TaxID=63787 RepID=A0A7N0TS75_KALFE